MKLLTFFALAFCFAQVDSDDLHMFLNPELALTPLQWLTAKKKIKELRTLLGKEVSYRAGRLLPPRRRGRVGTDVGAS
uniref:Uncharacterized protein n=1 Tax=Steinernema glaseri TaxID=37863 RepID=A0A1I7Y0Q3_9BILA